MNIKPAVRPRHGFKPRARLKENLYLKKTPDHRRTYFVFFLLALVALAIISKLFFLQIIQGDHYKAWAAGQQMIFEEDQGLRGNIYLTAGGFPLTQAKNKYIIYVYPGRLKEGGLESEAEALSALLKEAKEEWIAILKKGEVVKREITEEQFNAFKNKRLSSVENIKIKTRFYPQDEFAANVIGFLGAEDEGQYGLEGYYQEELAGDSGLLQSHRSPWGYLLNGPEGNEKSGRGDDLWLSLDYKVQYLAEKLLKKAKQDWDIDSGQIIVQEPSTGRILAMANYPSFNPNKYAEQKSLDIYLNKAVQTTFEPGSIFKPITMAAGLAEGLVTPETTYIDTGSVSAGGPLIYNFAKYVFGRSSMTDVLKQSINTGVIFVEEKLGKERFLKYAAKFGLMDKSGVDLQGEVYSTNATLKNGYPRDFAVASFGQGIEVTPLQMVQAFSAIANQGKMMRPYVVEKRVHNDGTEIITPPKQVAEVISPKVAQQLGAMMEKVVSAGSGRRAKINDYLISGKTGTAQVIAANGKYDESATTQSFLGFFPTKEPRATILVKLDNPKGSADAGSSATPIAREMIKIMLDLWQIPPENTAE